MADLLQKFLDRRILSIGESDENFNKLAKAAAELAKSLIAKPEEVPFYTLVALDAETSANEPRIEQVLTLVTKHWKTVISQSADTPITLLRAVIAQALTQAIKENPACAAGAWWTGLNYLPFASLSGEEEIWGNLLKEAGQITQKQATRFWGGVGNTTTTVASSFKASPAVAVEAKVKTDLIGQYLIAASGPSGGNAGDLTRNPYAPYNQQANWAVEFADISSTGLSNEINRALGLLSAALNKTAQGQQELASTILQQATSMMSQATAAAQSTALRTQLLWWHTAGYSELLNTSYACLTPEIAVVAMVADLHALVPEYTPSSVEAFLERSIQSHVAKNDETKLVDWLAKLSVAPESIKTIFGPAKATIGRRPLLEEVRGVLHGSVSSTIHPNLGVAADLALTLPAIGVWLFRDFQAYRVTRKK
jgi:hypothetical protein